MSDPALPLFDVATDGVLADMITHARRRIMVVAPALTQTVAEALVARLDESQAPTIDLILDADPEVYRLGYGDLPALELLRDRFVAHGQPIRQQAGIRLGVIVADDEMIVFSPTPRLIEAGSSAPEKPNAIRLGDTGAAARMAEAVGAGETPAEIGTKPLTPSDAQAVTTDLKANPPQKFDLARAVRVFSSQARYVELKVENCRFATRSVPWPPLLLNITDPDLRRQIEGRFKPFASFDWKVKVTAIHAEGQEREVEMDEKWLNRQRKDLEAITFEVKAYGRVLLRQHQDTFHAGAARLQTNMKRYRDALMQALEAKKAEIASLIVKEFKDRWFTSPPEQLTKWGKPSDEDLLRELQSIADRMVEDAISFQEPTARVVIKDIAPESVQSEEFVTRLKDAMARAHVPERIIKNLWETYAAARRAEPGTA